MAVPQEVLNHFKTYPIDKVHPMSALRTAVSMLALYDDAAEDMSEEANYLKAIQLQAKMSTLVTAFSRVRKGLEPVAPKTDLGYAANFLYMLSVKCQKKLKLKLLTKPCTSCRS